MLFVMTLFLHCALGMEGVILKEVTVKEGRSVCKEKKKRNRHRKSAAVLWVVHVGQVRRRPRKVEKKLYQCQEWCQGETKKDWHPDVL